MSEKEDPDEFACVGAIVARRGQVIDTVLAEVVAALRESGASVAGYVQRYGERLPSGKSVMWLENVADGQRARLDIPRGPLAEGCVLDTGALATASAALGEAIGGGVDLVVINRFGISEAEGEGLRTEIAAAVCAGIPVLIGVREDRLEALDDFLGAPVRRLAPDSAAALAWARSALALGAAGG